MSVELWLIRLLRVSVESAVLLTLIWALTRAWTRMPAAARCALWWLGALRAIVGLVPVPTIPVALPGLQPTLPNTLPTPVLELGNAMAGAVARTPARDVASAVVPAANPIAVVALAIWIAGVVVSLALMIRRIAAIRRAWCAATPFADARVARWRDDWAIALGRGRVPEVRASAETKVPVAIGVFRPGLLLPADSTRLSDDALRVVLAHEMSHVRRRDPLLAWVPAAAQVLFWFHPLLRFAAREYLAAREQICDADALRATRVSPRDYGSLLLDYGVGQVAEVPGLASCGSRGSRDLKRRIEMLSHTHRTPVRHRVGAVALTLTVVAVAFTPIRFVAARETEDPRASAEKAKMEVKRALEQERIEQTDELEKAHVRSKRELERKIYSHSPYERTPFAYAIKIRDEKGTQGSVDEIDMEGLRRLDHDNQTAVYFRLGKESWISTDPDVITRVRREVEHETRFSERQTARQGVNQGLERERAKMEMARTDLEQRQAELEARKTYLRELEKMRAESGRPVDDLRGEQEELEQQSRALWEDKERLRRSYDMVHEKMKSSYAGDKQEYAERDELHRQILERIAEIARAAIDEGRADRFIY